MVEIYGKTKVKSRFYLQNRNISRVLLKNKYVCKEKSIENLNFLNIFGAQKYLISNKLRQILKA